MRQCSFYTSYCLGYKTALNSSTMLYVSSTISWCHAMVKLIPLCFLLPVCTTLLYNILSYGGEPHSLKVPQPSYVTGCCLHNHRGYVECNYGCRDCGGKIYCFRLVICIMGVFVFCVGVPSSPLSLAHFHTATLFLPYWLKQDISDSDSSREHFVFLPVLPCFSSGALVSKPVISFSFQSLFFFRCFFFFFNYRSVLLAPFWEYLSLLHVFWVLWHSISLALYTVPNHNSF